MTEQTTKEAILETLAGKIIARLETFTGAVEESTLEQAIRYVAKTTIEEAPCAKTIPGTNLAAPQYRVARVSKDQIRAEQARATTYQRTIGYTMIPRSVYLAALKHLAALKLVRKVKTRDGLILIALSHCNNLEISEAAQLHRSAAKQSRRNFFEKLESKQLAGLAYAPTDHVETIEIPRAQYSETLYFTHTQTAATLLKTRSNLLTLKNIPSPTAPKYMLEGEVSHPELDPESAANSMTTDPTAGLQYEAALIAEHMDAETRTNIETEFPSEPIQQDTIENRIDGELVQLLITQQQTNQGHRNTVRANNRRAKQEVNAYNFLGLKDRDARREFTSNMRRNRGQLELQIAAS